MDKARISAMIPTRLIASLHLTHSSHIGVECAPMRASRSVQLIQTAQIFISQ